MTDYKLIRGNANQPCYRLGEMPRRWTVEHDDCGVKLYTHFPYKQWALDWMSERINNEIRLVKQHD